MKAAVEKPIIALIIAVGIAPIAAAQIAVEVYQADGETPFQGSDIMVGAKAVIIVGSDSNDYWSGGLFIAGQDRAFGTLGARGLDPNTRDWTGSHYKDAGALAKLIESKDSAIWGFDLYTFYPVYPVDPNLDKNTTVPGAWFIIDYYADKVGSCNVGFYDYSISWDEPVYNIRFSHVPTRDLKSDQVVNFHDFAILASQWNGIDCIDANWCDGADLDRNGEVDYGDRRLFVEYWLWGIPHDKPTDIHREDPNVTFSIVDANGDSEITVDVNSSITLYVDMATTQLNNVGLFDIEVDISDPNLGSIDNMAYDTIDPPGTGSARILAEPRDPCFDYWAPGSKQEEGIRLQGANIGPAMSDGHLASFVFTCKAPGDVVLDLTSWLSSNTRGDRVYPKLASITIHQVGPNSP